MTANRLQQVIRARWWVLLLIAVVAVGAASLVNGLRDSTLLDRKAEAGITFNRLLGELDNVLVQERMRAAASAAEDVNAAALAGGLGPLSAGPTNLIALNARDSRLEFIGFGTTDEEATERAVGMRDRYLEEQALDGTAEIDRRINVVAAQLDEIMQKVEVETALTPPTPVEIVRDARITELQAQVTALAGRYGTLTVELITPGDPTDPIPPRSTSEILAEREDVRSAMLEAQTELTELELERDAVEPENAALALLRTRETQLRLALDTLVASRITEEPIGSLDAVETSTASIATTPTFMTLAIGFLAGLLVGLVGLMLVDRLRQPLWSAADVEPHHRLPEVQKRSSAGHRQTGTVWYQTAPPGGRKTGIQQLRSNVEGLTGFGDSLAIGIAAVHGHSRDVHELAADLASGLAGSGSRALLIDVDFDRPSDLIEFTASGHDIDEMLRDDKQAKAVLTMQPAGEVRCVGIGAGGQGDDSPDLLAQRAFAKFLDKARAAFDVVIVASPPSDSATYHVLTQRLDGMILVAASGETLSSQVDSAMHTLDDRRSEAVGVLILTRPRDRFSRLLDWINGRSDEDDLDDDDLEDEAPAGAADEPKLSDGVPSEGVDAPEKQTEEKVPVTAGKAPAKAARATAAPATGRKKASTATGRPRRKRTGATTTPPAGADGRA